MGAPLRLPRRLLGASPVVFSLTRSPLIVILVYGCLQTAQPTD